MFTPCEFSSDDTVSYNIIQYLLIAIIQYLNTKSKKPFVDPVFSFNTVIPRCFTSCFFIHPPKAIPQCLGNKNPSLSE